ncbi:MAG: adenylate/guanylate cyclase domain-containing protein [Candidatus Rifleibacteriota bacterium]
MKTKLQPGSQNRISNILLGLTLVLLILLPANFIAEGIAGAAKQNFERQKVSALLELQHELLRFKLDLIPRYQAESIIRDVEKACGLVPLGQKVPNFGSGQFPDVYNDSTLAQMLAKFKLLHDVEPVFLLTASADLAKIKAFYSNDLKDLPESDKKSLEANVACCITDLSALKSVVNDPLAEERFSQLFKSARGSYKNQSDSLYVVLRKVFSELYCNPRYHGSTYEICGDRFGSLRMFLHYNRMKEREKFYGGYFVVLASKDLEPETLMKKALRPAIPGLIRGFGDQAKFDKASLYLESLTSGEIFGYSRLFNENFKIPEKIFVSRSLNEEIKRYKQIKTNVSMAKKIVLLISIFLLAAIALRGWPDPGRLKLQLLLMISLIVLIPYVVLGYLSFMLLDGIDKLRPEEARAEIERHLYELERYYEDQKLQHLARLFAGKQRLITHMSDSDKNFDELDAHKIVESDFHGNFFFYRDDGYSRKFASGVIQSKRSLRLYEQISASILSNLGFLDKNSGKAKKDLEFSSLTDGFLSESKRGFLEHEIFTREGVEVVDFSKVDDFSRIVFFLIPQKNKVNSTVKGLVIAPVADINTNIYQQHNFKDSVFFKHTLFSQANLSLGMRRGNDTLSQWWPDKIGSSSNLKRLLDFSSITHSSGSLVKNGERSIDIDKWLFKKGESMVFAAHIQSNSNIAIELYARIFPLLLFLFSLISLFLFADLLDSLFIAPVYGLSKAARLIGLGNYQVRLQVAGQDELAELSKSFNQMADSLAQREKLRRFISEDLFQQIKVQKSNFEAQKLTCRNLTVLASDIRGFTAISEKYNPEEVVSLLNDYFTEMEAAITAYGGHIVRFVGDAVIAAFYHDDPEISTMNAVKAALKMREALMDLNRRRLELKLFTIENGIGIASGQAFAGVAGAAQGRKVFCVVGDLTMRAEELEAMSKMSNFNRILLCEKSAECARNSLKLVRLETKNDSAPVYDLVGACDV